ncbi:hypothetical protein Q0N12_14240 [Rossellomorea marisflavi]
MQRRTDDSFGNRGKIETLQASAEAAQLTPRGKRPTAAKRNAITTTTLHPISRKRDKVTHQTSHPSSKSAVQRRTDDSRGNRGKIETLQAQPKRLN